LTGDARKAYLRLAEVVREQQSKGKHKSFENQLLDAIDHKISMLLENPFYGNNIPKRLIPKKYGVKNLWRVELTRYWRMLYTITSKHIKIVCFILDILPHKEYDKKFGYKKK